MSGKTTQFYSNLSPTALPLRELLLREDLFFDVPAGWHVIITDIRNSTAAVSGGMHETVNLIATGSIVAVLNIAYSANIVVPFFFGGDGATFIVPPSIIKEAMEALLLFRQNTQTNFDLDLRVGTVAVSHLYATGHQLRISKFRSSATLSIPVVLGTGLAHAEKLIKAKDYLAQVTPPNALEPDLRGMECRWDQISPPAEQDEIVTLLVTSGSSLSQAQAFSGVITLLDTIYGTPERRQPISVHKLQLKTSFSRIELELSVKQDNNNLFMKLYTWFTHSLVYFYFLTRRGKDYLVRLVNMSDTLVIDGRINTVISGSVKQRKMLEQALLEMENKGEIKFGFYVSTASVMSCYVRDLQDDHIHFVDGAGGGYTQAASMLKLKSLS